MSFPWLNVVYDKVDFYAIFGLRKYKLYNLYTITFLPVKDRWNIPEGHSNKKLTSHWLQKNKTNLQANKQTNKQIKVHKTQCRNLNQNLKDGATRTQLNTGRDLSCFGRLGKSCSTFGTRHVSLNLVISRIREKLTGLLFIIAHRSYY